MNKIAIFNFGRENPPHIGHVGVFKTMRKEALKANGDWFIFSSKSHDADKNPLSYSTKLKWIQTLCPWAADHIIIDPKLRTLLQCAAYLYNMGYEHVIFVAGEDDIETMKIPLEKYNGDDTSNYFNFKTIKFVPAPRIAHATDAREAAREGNEDAFYKATRVKRSITVDGLSLYEAVRAGMGMSDINLAEDIGDFVISDDLGLYDLGIAINGNKIYTSDSCVKKATERNITNSEISRILHNAIKNSAAEIDALPPCDFVIRNKTGICIGVKKIIEIRTKYILMTVSRHLKSDHDFLVEEEDSLNIQFHDSLNPALWTNGKLLPEVKEKLDEIANDFKTFLGVRLDTLNDITISGSNAAYSYTPSSDIDLHLIVDIPQIEGDSTYRELFDSKKFQYNTIHNYTIKGYPVELYVQNANDVHHSAGIYSLKNEAWIKRPSNDKITIDEVSARSKYNQLKCMIELAEKSKNKDLVDNLKDIVKRYRKVGLDVHGEFGPENIAYKALRTNGYIKRLYDLAAELKDKSLSLENISESQLNEIADSSYEFDDRSIEKFNNGRYTFNTEDGSKINVYIDVDEDDSTLAHIWFARDGFISASGGGDAFKIFSTVAKILKKYLSSHINISSIEFSAREKEQSRVKLYDAFIKMLPKVFPEYKFVGNGTDGGKSDLEKTYKYSKITEEWSQLNEINMSPSALSKTNIDEFTMGFEVECTLPIPKELLSKNKEYELYLSDIVNTNNSIWEILSDLAAFYHDPDVKITKYFAIYMVSLLTDAEIIEATKYFPELNNVTNISSARRGLYDLMNVYSFPGRILDWIDNASITLANLDKYINNGGTFESLLTEMKQVANDNGFSQFNITIDSSSFMKTIIDECYPYYADAFGKKFNVAVSSSTNYHGASRNSSWAFESDSSIAADDKMIGMEIISPPMNLSEALPRLLATLEWIKELGGKTNSSTGLHINMSVPNLLSRLDGLKLIIMLGDNHVLEMFGRASNIYTESSIKKAAKLLGDALQSVENKKREKSNNNEPSISDILPPIDYVNELKKLKDGFNSMIYNRFLVKMLKFVHLGKHMSVNFGHSTKYIEFRSMGNDYLDRAPEITNNIMRFARVMASACDPNMDKEEYSKKLYKFIMSSYSDSIPTEEMTTIQLFSLYSANKMTKDILKSALKYKKNERNNNET